MFHTPTGISTASFATRTRLPSTVSLLVARSTPMTQLLGAMSNNVFNTNYAIRLSIYALCMPSIAGQVSLQTGRALRYFLDGLVCSISTSTIDQQINQFRSEKIKK